MDLFPYTNFHELNLDWMLGIIKKNTTEINNIWKKIFCLESKINKKEKNSLLTGFSSFCPVGACITSGGYRYLSWPWNNIFFDSYRNRVGVVYNASTGHAVVTEGKVYCQFFNNSAPFTSTSPLVVAAFEDGRATCHTVLKLKNNNLIAFIRKLTPTYNKIYLFRSIDGGTSWNNEGELTDCFGNVICPDDGTVVSVHGGYVLENGEIIISVHNKTKTEVSIYMAGNNGQNGTYTLSQIIVNNLGGDPYELSFAENPNSHTITALCRRNEVVDTELENPVGILITKSFDGGKTWTDFGYTNQKDCQTNPCSIVEYPDEGYVEIMWCSRQKYRDGLGSVYQSICSYEMLENGDLGNAVKIGKGSASGNFGYLGTCKTVDSVWMAYYNGSTGYTTINVFRAELCNKGNPVSIDNVIVAEIKGDDYNYTLYQNGYCNYKQEIKINLGEESAIINPYVNFYNEPYVSDGAEFIAPQIECDLFCPPNFSQIMLDSKVSIEPTFGGKIKVTVGDISAHPSVNELNLLLTIKGILK